MYPAGHRRTVVGAREENDGETHGIGEQCQRQYDSDHKRAPAKLQWRVVGDNIGQCQQNGEGGQAASALSDHHGIDWLGGGIRNDRKIDAVAHDRHAA